MSAPAIMRLHRVAVAATMLLGLALPLAARAQAGGATAPAASSTAPQGRHEAVRLDTPTGTLHGTLQLPTTPAARVPVALVVSGSGPTDRNGNSAVLAGPNNSLKLLAEGLAAQGIATLRYDKRGIGESRGSMTSEAGLTFDTYVDDAAAWLRMLRADARFSTVSVIGHSEGALIALLAGERAPADGVVSVAGMGEPAQAVLRRQLQPQLPPPLYAQAESALVRLEAGQPADSTPPALAALLRPSVQPFLISLFRHDPAAIAARLPMPLLVVQGTTDVQVGVEQAQRLRAAQPGARLLQIEGMNHVLKLRSGTVMEQLPSYSDPALPLAPTLVPGIADFVRGLPLKVTKD